MAISPLLNKINNAIVNPLITLLFAVAFLVFLYGIFQFIANTGSDEGREKGKKNMLYGIIGLFIMIAVYGIIHIILGTFGVTAPAGGSYLPGIYQ